MAKKGEACTFGADQLVGSSDLTRSFATYFKRAIAGEEFFISKNNRVEAVLVGLEEYEHLCRLADIAERRDIARIVNERKDADRSKNVNAREILDKYGL